MISDNKLRARAQACALSTTQIGRHDLINFMMMNYPMNTLMEMLAEYVLEDVTNTAQPIVMTQEQFNAHFRIRNVRPDGTTETRGRKPLQEQTTED